MFSLNYLDTPETERLHAGWCETNIDFFREPNPLPCNPYIDWLHGVGERIFVCSPEYQLYLVNGFYTVLKDSIQNFSCLFEVLTRASFPKFEAVVRDGVCTDINFSFQWLDVPDLSDVKTLLGRRSSPALDVELRACLAQLGVREDVEELLDGREEQTLSARFKKVFNPSGRIIISLTAFGVFDYFEGFIATCKRNFDYSKFTSSYAGWGAYELVRSVGNSVCPYCNRGFTHSVEGDEVGRGRPELDHFLPKSVFPFFSVSLYNLIPVCHTCNHAKSDDSVLQGSNGVFSFSHLHPNVTGDDVSDSVVFETVNEGDLASFLLSNTASLNDKLSLTDECLVNEKLSKSLATYKLARISEGEAYLIGYYAHHYKDIERLLNMVKRYPVRAIESIANLVGGDARGLQRNFMEVLISDRPDEEPLGKLKSDLLASVVDGWQERA